MNFEEKYNGALERAKALCNDADTFTIYDITTIFPELEEDMIRKDIISYLRNEKIVKRYISDIEIDKWIAWLEKQGEQNHADKVEPKFNVRDWVILNSTVAQILDKQKYGFVGLDIDGKDFFCNYGHTDSMRLWTINDAKDGDVLVNGSNIFIFHFINGTRLMGYCHVNMDNELLYDDIGRNECFCLIDAIVTPATKEQRVLLFSKIKEAGYEWDAYKKELKKIEATSKKNEDEKIRKAILGLVKQSSEILGKQNQNNMIAWLEKLNPVWSEEDEQMILSIEQIMNCASLLNIVPEKIDNIKSWLKSLRPQKQWKPSTAHKREIDDAYLQGICDAKQEIEKQGKQSNGIIEPRAVYADKVIAWIVANICDFEYYIKRFKQDFGI